MLPNGLLRSTKNKTVATVETTYSLAANGADGYFNNANWQYDAAGDGNLTVGSNGGVDEWSGFFRFDGIAVVKSATVVSAILEIESNQNQSGTTINIEIACTDADDAVAPVDSTAALAGAAAITTAKTTTTLAAQTAGTRYQYDITTSVQEVINRAGWATGQAICVYMIGLGTTTAGAHRVMKTHEGGASDATSLIITV